MHTQPSDNGNSIGTGLLGCAGGLILGLVGGGLLLVLLSLGWALLTAVPAATTAAPAPGRPDLRLTLNETFLGRTIQDSTAEAVSVDIRPDNRFSLQLDTAVSVLGTTLPVQLTGLFELQLVNQALAVQLVETQVFGLDLPPELANFFNDNLPAIHHDINQALTELSAALNLPLIPTGLGTDETRFWLEARLTP